jgi:hypothetical protein
MFSRSRATAIDLHETVYLDCPTPREIQEKPFWTISTNFATSMALNHQIPAFHLSRERSNAPAIHHAATGAQNNESPVPSIAAARPEPRAIAMPVATLFLLSAMTTCHAMKGVPSPMIEFQKKLKMAPRRLEIVLDGKRVPGESWYTTAIADADVTMDRRLTFIFAVACCVTRRD